MNTPAHMIMACLYVRRDTPKLLGVALLGGLAPDLSLYLMVFWARLINGFSFQTIFDEKYFSDEWQSVFSVDNSFLVWGVILLLGFLLARNWLKILAAGALTHLVFDILLHHDDGRAHFWPVSDWVFESPVSYWDPRHYGHIVGPIEIALVAVMVFILWRRFAPNLWVYVIAALGLLQIIPGIMFSLMFSGP
ncbi:MAG: cobalamin biosynthesis protein CobQ [Pseudomonadota bacterium]